MYIRKIMTCLFIVFENYILFLKINENKENSENGFSSHFDGVKNKENKKTVLIESSNVVEH